MTGNFPRGGFSHVTDAQGKEDPLKRNLPGVCQALQEAARTALFPAFQLEELILCKGI